MHARNSDSIRIITLSIDVQVNVYACLEYANASNSTRC